MFRMIKSSTDNILTINIEIKYNSVIESNQYINCKNNTKHAFNNKLNQVVKSVKSKLNFYGFTVLQSNVSKYVDTSGNQSISTYYDTKLVSKQKDIIIIVFIRISHHDVSFDQNQKNEENRFKKAKKYLKDAGVDKDTVEKGVDWFDLEISVAGKKYKNWDLAMNKIDQDIKNFLEYSIEHKYPKKFKTEFKKDDTHV